MLPGETIASGAPDRCPDCGQQVKLAVCCSAAGYYIGGWCDCGPYCRESGYFASHKEAEDAFSSGNYGR